MADRLQAVARATVTLLGWTEAFAYDAGELQDGARTIKFDAGKTFKVCVAVPNHATAFEVLKVKSAEADRVLEGLKSCGRGTEVEIEFVQTTGRGEARLMGLKALAGAK